MNKVKACFVFLAGIVALLIVGGCVAGLQNSSVMPPNTAAVCRNRCEQIGLQMGAVVIMDLKIGCVCEPASGQGQGRGGEMAQRRSRVRGGALAVAGGAVVIEEEEAKRDE